MARSVTPKSSSGLNGKRCLDTQPSEASRDAYRGASPFVGSNTQPWRYSTEPGADYMADGEPCGPLLIVDAVDIKPGCDYCLNGIGIHETIDTRPILGGGTCTALACAKCITLIR
jgi:hypothetical protein